MWLTKPDEEDDASPALYVQDPCSEQNDAYCVPCYRPTTHINPSPNPRVV